MDNILFLVLSSFIVGSVLFGYKTFAINLPHYSHLGSGEQGEDLKREGRQLYKGLSFLRFGKHITYEDISETDMMDSLADAQEYYSDIVDRLLNPASVSGLMFAILDLYRGLFYNTLFLLSVFYGLPFHLFFSLFLCCLMMTGAILLSKITIVGYRQSTGKFFFLLPQLIFIFVNTGRTILGFFSVSLLLFLYYLPSEERKSHSMFLYGICLLLATVSRGAFFVVYVFCGLQALLLWKVLNVTHRTMLTTIVLLFFPFAFSAVWTTALMGITGESGIIAHGSFANISHLKVFREIVLGIFLLVLYAVALFPFVPRLSPSLWLDHYFHALSVALVVGGAFSTANIGLCLLALDALLLKITVFDNIFLQNMKSRGALSIRLNSTQKNGGGGVNPVPSQSTNARILTSQYRDPPPDIQ